VRADVWKEFVELTNQKLLTKNEKKQSRHKASKLLDKFFD